MATNSGTRRTSPLASPASTMAPKPCPAAAIVGSGPIAPVACQISGTSMCPRTSTGTPGGGGVLAAGLRTKPSTEGVPFSASATAASPSGNLLASLAISSRSVASPRLRMSSVGERRSGSESSMSRPMTCGLDCAIFFNRSAITSRPHGHGPRRARLSLSMSTTITEELCGRAASSPSAWSNVSSRIFSRILNRSPPHSSNAATNEITPTPATDNCRARNSIMPTELITETN